MTNSRDISIHRLLAEPDSTAKLDAVGIHEFQSTGSLRSPTKADVFGFMIYIISIHRLLAEPDSFCY